MFIMKKIDYKAKFTNTIGTSIHESCLESFPMFMFLWNSGSDTNLYYSIRLAMYRVAYEEN